MSFKRANTASQVIAIAGATGDVGSHIVEALLDTDKFTVILLLRKEIPDVVTALQERYPKASSRLHTNVVDISTTSLGPLVEIFQTYSVDTIISCIWNRDHAAVADAQQALLLAAEKAPSVRRYVPNDWGSGIDKDTQVRPSLYDGKFPIVPKLDASSLNWISFANGIFMDYWGAGAPRTFIEPDSTTHMKVFPYIVNVKEATATIPVPDDGLADKKVSWTRMSDVARYVVGACLLDGVAWDGKSIKAAGWTGTLPEAIQIAERVTGKTFTVKRTPVSDMIASITPSTPTMPRFYAEATAALGLGYVGWNDELGRILQEQGLGFTAKSLEDTLKEAWN